MAKNRNRLFEMLEEGMFDAFTLARDLMGYMSDDEIADFARKNDIELFPDEEEEPEEFEFTDEDEVREAFASYWAEAIQQNPAYATDRPAKRQAFSVFVDDLQRDGRISDELADSVTLGDDE